jgi:hypothetical protein
VHRVVEERQPAVGRERVSFRVLHDTMRVRPGVSAALGPEYCRPRRSCRSRFSGVGHSAQSSLLLDCLDGASGLRKPASKVRGGVQRRVTNPIENRHSTVCRVFPQCHRRSSKVVVSTGTAATGGIGRRYGGDEPSTAVWHKAAVDGSSTRPAPLSPRIGTPPRSCSTGGRCGRDWRQHGEPDSSRGPWAAPVRGLPRPGSGRGTRTFVR